MYGNSEMTETYLFQKKKRMKEREVCMKIDGRW